MTTFEDRPRDPARVREWRTHSSWRFLTSCARTHAHVKIFGCCRASAPRRTVSSPRARRQSVSGIHPKTLTRAAAAGQVAGARRVGRHWRFDPAELILAPPHSPPGTSAPNPRPAPLASPHRGCGRDSHRGHRRFRVASRRLPCVCRAQIARSSVRPKARRARTDVSEAPTVTPNDGMRDAEHRRRTARHPPRRAWARDALAGSALAQGLDRRAITRTLSLANATVRRRNGSGAE
jgi:hypothetical protein